MKRTESLLAALNLAKSSLGPSEAVMPVLGHFCFMGDILYAYNDITAIIVAEDTGLLGALHGDTLIRLLSVAKSDDMKIKMKDGIAEINTGNGWMEVPALPSTDFQFVLPDETPIVSLPFTDEIATALERCLLSVGKDSLRPHFTGVTIDITKDGIMLYSSDNNTATRYNALQGPGKKAFSAVIPALACEQMLKLRQKDAMIEFGTKVATMETQQATLVTKLLPSKVEQFTKIFDEHAEGKVFFPVPPTLIQEITKADVLLGREAIKECTITFTEGLCTVIAAGILGSMLTEIKIAEKLKQATVCVSPEHLLRILPHAQMMGVTHTRSLVFVGGGMVHIVSSRATSGDINEPMPGPIERDTPARRVRPSIGAITEDDIPF